MTRRRVRLFVVPLLLVGLVAVPVMPARAFLSTADPAGWAVVAQMAAVVSQGIAIKRQVENVRNQARAHFFGKLAPLTGKLGRVRDMMRGNRYTGTIVLTPTWGVDRLDAADVPVFNQTYSPCSVATPGTPCLLDDATVDPDRVADLSQPALDALDNHRAYSAFQYHASGNTAARNALTRAQDLLDARLAQQQDAVELATERRNERRAALDSAMQTVEDWFGCQPAPYAPAIGDPIDVSTDDRTPCVTNEGLGRGDGAAGDEGTRGIAEDLVSKIAALEALQEGDASQVQIDTIQTQVLIQLARIAAARAALQARLVEQQERKKMEGEAARRRRVALYGAYLECVGSEGIFARFIPDPNQPGSIPPAGTCEPVDDVRDDIVNEFGLSSLWNP